MEALIEMSRELIHAYGYLGIFSLTTLEQFIFPVPADIIIAAGTSNGLVVSKVIWIVFAAAVLGSIIGYLLGKYLGHPAMLWLFGQKRLDHGEKFIKKWGVWGVIIAGLTPIPFKLVTWSAGIFEMPFKKFVLAVIIGRMPRYIAAAYAASFFVDKQLITGENSAALLLGAIQGITEFLPISSSGHLVIMEHFLDVPVAASQLLTFDIFLHGGSLIAILLYFWKDWVQVLKQLWHMIRSFELHTSTLAFKLAAGTIPAIIAGLLLGDAISNNLRTLHWVAIFFIIVGSVYFYTAWKGRKSSSESVSLKKSVLIGCAQALALIPGVSRAGSTIAAGVFMGIKRDVAAKFSFMLGAIAILAANVYSLLTLSTEAALPSTQFILTGAITSFATSIVAIYLLLKFLEKRSLVAFGIYLVLAGTAILSFL